MNYIHCFLIMCQIKIFLNSQMPVSEIFEKGWG